MRLFFFFFVSVRTYQCFSVIACVAHRKLFLGRKLHRVARSQLQSVNAVHKEMCWLVPVGIILFVYNVCYISLTNCSINSSLLATFVCVCAALVTAVSCEGEREQGQAPLLQL